MQILDVGPNDGRRAFIGHIDEVIAVILVERIFVVLLFFRRFAHDERFGATGRREVRRVDVYRQKEIAARLVRNVGAGLQIVLLRGGQRLVRRARVDHLDARHSLFDEFAQPKHDLQCDVLFVDACIVSARVGATVACVEHDDIDPAGGLFGCRCVLRDGKCREECEECEKMGAHVGFQGRKFV